MNATRYFAARLRNGARTLGFLFALSGLLVLSGWLLFGAFGSVMMLVLLAGALLASSSLPLSVMMRMRGARPLLRGEADDVRIMVARLAHKAGLKSAPSVYVLPSPELSAFAVAGRDETGIGLTPGLLYGLAEDELEAVLAHEISHVASGDMRVMNAARAMRSLTRSLASVAWFLLLLSLLTLGALQISLSAMLLMAAAPALSYLAELGLSRTREFGADLAAARLTGRPAALARALVKLERHHRGLVTRLFGGNATLDLPAALRTHPLTEERVRRLLVVGPDAPLVSDGPTAPPHFQPHLLSRAHVAHSARSPMRTTRWSVTMS